MSCSNFRGVEERLKWFLSNRPAGGGMCAQHTWHALGGDRGCPPRWGTPDANAMYDKIIASGRYWKGDPPRGAIVVWKYGKHGHAALSMGGGRIATTDPMGKYGGVGTESLSYPERVWGASARQRIWTDTYNGTLVGVEGEEDDEMTDEQIKKLAREIADEIWNRDTVDTDNPANPNWQAGTYMRFFLRELKAVNENLAKLLAKP